MRINIDQGVALTPDSIQPYVYPDGSAYIELGTGSMIGQSILIWAGTEGTDPVEEARALRKLAEVATELAAGLDLRAGTGPEQPEADDRGVRLGDELRRMGGV